jgi:hypothetical protein
MARVSPGVPNRVVLFTGVTDDETLSQSVQCAGCPNVTVYLIGTGVTSGGTITIEEAEYDTDDTMYVGTWSIIGSAHNASDVSGGKQKAVHLSVGAYAHVRARVSDAITGGGSIAAVLVAS